ncbi:MAG: hypothetical protein ACSLFI_05245 [Solirubrobacterales bacterium]
MGKKSVAACCLILIIATGFFLPAEAGATRYTVAQCGWHVGHDATWADTSADKFTRSSYCQTPASADPFENVHLNSETRGTTDSVAGTRYARWRWQAPTGTGIVTVHGQRWQVLRDGFQHRIGSQPAAGSFKTFLEAATTDMVKRDFAGSFSPFAPAVESRLLCAKADDKFCDAEKSSLAGVRGLTFTLDDSRDPTTMISGGLASSAWLRGTQTLSFSTSDVGSGLRYSQTRIDGAIRAQTELPCNMELIAGQWRGTKMQPCGLQATGSHSVSTAKLSDGPHRLRECGVDFAGNFGCAADQTLRTDNNAPAAPRGLAVTGGEAWRQSNDFNLTWVDPDQGVAAPIVGSRYRVTDAAGFDSGVKSTFGSGGLGGLRVPAAGEYRVSVWLVDAAGNENPSASAEATIRLDDQPPSGYFLEPEEDRPEHLRVPVADAHSGVAGGYISYRRQGTGSWHRLPTELALQDGRMLRADVPSSDLAPGIYEFEARVLDLAGNGLITGKRGNGSPMTLRAPVKDETSLTARLRFERRSGLALQVPFGKRARLSGRLTGAGGNGLPGQEVRILQAPAFGSRAGETTIRARTGRDGFFSVLLPSGTTRLVSLRFDGTPKLMESSAGPLELKVKGSVSLRATPRRLKTGQRLGLSGRVDARGARRPSRGNLVAIQYLETASGKWRPVLVTRTGRLGNFHARYRFRYITGSARIRLRAVLLPSQYFPFDSAASRTVKVEVRG